MRTYNRVCQGQEKKCHEHTQWYTQCHKEGIGTAHKEHQNQ